MRSPDPPSLFVNLLPQPDGRLMSQVGSGSAAPDQAVPSNGARAGQGQHAEAAGARLASRRELFRRKVAAAQAGVPRQPQPRPFEAGQPVPSQPRLGQAESNQRQVSRSESEQIEPSQPELTAPEAASASPVAAAGEAPSGSTGAAAGDGADSAPEEAPAMAAGLPRCAASSGKPAIRMRGAGAAGAEPAMPQDRSSSSSSTTSEPEEGDASEAGSPQEAAKGSERSIHWVENAAMQEVADADEEPMLNIRRMSAVKRSEQDVESSGTAAPEDDSSSSSASSKPEEAALSADDTVPAEEAEDNAAEVHWSENTTLEEGAVPGEDLMFAIRRMSAAARERTRPVLASSDPAMPAESALPSPQSAHQAGQGSTAQRSGSIDNFASTVQALSTPASASPSRNTSPMALECATSALHPVASTDTFSQPGRADAGQAAQGEGSPAQTGFEHLLARFVGSPAMPSRSVSPASLPLAMVAAVASEPLGECCA